MGRTITAKVGENGINRYDDVVTIQELLNQIDPTEGGASPKLVVDGKCGAKTKEAIQKFQLKQFGWKLADGRVDPGGPALQRMNECVGGPASWKKSMLLRIRRNYPDSFVSAPGVMDVFEVQDQANHRRAFYVLASVKDIVVPPEMVPGNFAGSWSNLRPFAPVSVAELGGPASLKTDVKPGPIPVYSTNLQVAAQAGPLTSLLSFQQMIPKQGYFKLVYAI